MSRRHLYLIEGGTPEAHHEVEPLTVTLRGRNRPKISAEVRAKVYARDHWQCKVCADADPARLTLDHIIPLSEGGSNRLDNLQTLCVSCNRAKGSNVPKRGGARRKEPFR